MMNIVMELSPWEVYRILAALHATNDTVGAGGKNDELVARFELAISRSSPVPGTRVNLAPDPENT